MVNLAEKIEGNVLTAWQPFVESPVRQDQQGHL